jgi:hypothetical protein
MVLKGVLSWVPHTPMMHRKHHSMLQQHHSSTYSTSGAHGADAVLL